MLAVPKLPPLGILIAVVGVGTVAPGVGQKLPALIPIADLLHVAEIRAAAAVGVGDPRAGVFGQAADLALPRLGQWLALGMDLPLLAVPATVAQLPQPFVVRPRREPVAVHDRLPDQILVGHPVFLIFGAAVVGG